MAKARKAVLETIRRWLGATGKHGDAYATGQTLFILRRPALRSTPLINVLAFWSRRSCWMGRVREDPFEADSNASSNQDSPRHGSDSFPSARQFG